MTALLRSMLGGGARRDALWLFGSQLVALAATFAATPIELERMGAERYSIVVVLSAAVGYVGLLDIGAAWSVMRFVPWYRERDDVEGAQRAVSSAVVVSLAVGLAFGLLVLALAAPLGSLINVSGASSAEVVDAICVVAAFIPVFLLSSLFSGLGRAVGMFPLVGVVTAGQIVGLNAVWVAVAGQHDDVLKVLVAQLLLGCCAIATYAVAIKARQGWALRPRVPRRASLREIISFGAKTSSGQAGLAMLLALDKPVLAATMPVSAIPAYSIPFALASRVTMISSSVSSAVFPPIVAALAAGDHGGFERLRTRAFAIVGLISGLFAVDCVFAGGPFLDWWLGGPVAEDGTVALAALGVGFGVLASGSIGLIVLDAAGRPGAAARIMATGGVAGLTLIGLLAAWQGTAAAASFGACAGLAVIGLGGIELARRQVVPASRRKVVASIFGAWGPLVLIGAAARAGAEALSLPSLPTAGLVVVATGALALRCGGRRGAEGAR